MSVDLNINTSLLLCVALLSSCCSLSLHRGVDDDGAGGRTGRHDAGRRPLERRSISVLQINERPNESQALSHCDTR